MYKLRIPLLAFILVIFSFGQARAQGLSTDPSPPDISKWKVKSSSKISSIVSDKVKYYLGFDITYQNPDDPNEFVRQFRVLLPFTVSKSNSVQDNNFFDMAVAYVTDGAEKDLLKVYIEKSDPVVSIRYRQDQDLKRDVPRQEGDYDIWLLNSSGNWIYSRNIHIKVDYFSESFEELDGEIVIVGIKYYLNRRDYRAHEVPYSFIITAIKDSKRGK